MIMDQKVEYFKLPFYKRLFSLVIDAMLSIMLFTILLIPISSVYSPKIDNDKTINECLIKMNEILLDSGLFVLDDSGVITPVVTDESIEQGYKYMDDDNTYKQIKIDSELFINENNVLIEVGSEEEMKVFYEENWNKIYIKVRQTEEFSYYNEQYIKVINEHTSVTYVISIIITVTIFFLIIPLINKNGRTIAKIIFKITVIDDEYRRANKLNIFLRQFFLILSIFSFFPAIISLVLVLLSKKGKTLHGILSATRLIDSNIYDSMLKKVNNKKGGDYR